VPLVGGIFTGPELNGNPLPGGSVCWQTVLPDGTARAEVRYTLRTGRGAVLYVRSSGVTQGRGEDIDPSERLFHVGPETH
jgi:hypothetical protein